ncbi:hypothetical protein [Streptomyces sp. NBC_01363]|uniref:hypothetical protein n=1 Tax=Streptomyces sp. NBC_01363 TaxID=2903840 RepID=UPI002256CA97|nr:hypothetical protein [Streptomyces sp. NBC_01363]MCX4734346.1 hypothetical protein [Streptomyces sp. NBC_01363]
MRENGVALPVLATDSNGNRISRDALPSAPPESRLALSDFDRSSVPPQRLKDLDKVARDRRVSVDLTNAERAFEKNPTAESQRDLLDAQRAYKKQLGDKPNDSGFAERLGEDAARHHVIPKSFPGAHRVDSEGPAAPGGPWR